MEDVPLAEPGPKLKDRNVLVLDLSRSMLAPMPEDDPASPQRQKIEVARTAVYRILQDAARSGAPFGMVTFTDSVRTPVPLATVHRDHLPVIENMVSLLTPSGRSAIWDAIGAAADLLRLGDDGVQGNILLVTDGWDNASARFAVPEMPGRPLQNGHADLVPYLLPPQSQVNLRIVGIGEGTERDKGVDATRMNTFLEQLKLRAQAIGSPGSFVFQEVRTGTQLFAQMVQAFLDIGYREDRPLEELHPEELAERAAKAARALKEPRQHGTVARLNVRSSPGPSAGASLSAPAAAVEVGVLPLAGTVPSYLKDRYGPLGEVIEAYAAGQYDRAFQTLLRAERYLPPVTRFYWEARIEYAWGQPGEAARSLLKAWSEAERLPAENQAQVARRLALLQAKMQNDLETETLVRFLDDTESRMEGVRPAVRDRLRDLLASLMELRGTYQLTRLAGEGDLQDAALRHEAAVEQVFGRLQDARLELAGTGPKVEGVLDFVEVCLAEMR